jgi:CRISPR system Cascade subunit CasA
MTTMNLTRDPWIPAVRSDGTRDMFSLNELFAQAHTLRDLAVKPHERIALMRLLLCITQAALDGPADEDAWEACGPLIQPRVKEYLGKWRSKFELFGDNERFLQTKPGILAPADPVMEAEGISRLNLNMASGESNATLFDNAASGAREFTPAEAALGLLSYQCFSPLLGRGYKGRSPCADSSMLHTFVRGSSLLETIHLNVLNRVDVLDSYGNHPNDRPVWEVFNGKKLTIADEELLTKGYLGRLVPLARSIWIESLRTMQLANGIVYDGIRESGYREAAATVLATEKGHVVLQANLEKAAWRDLTAICVKKKAAQASASGPVAFKNPFRAEEMFIWTAGIVSDQAKIRDVVEASYAVPRSLLDDQRKRSAYERGVMHSEKGECVLEEAVGEYAKALKSKAPIAKAKQQFWTHVEQSLPALFDMAHELTTDEELPRSKWGQAVQAAALNAYRQVCPCQTPRQIQAHALGLRRLSFNTTLKSVKPKKGITRE